MKLSTLITLASLAAMSCTESRYSNASAGSAGGLTPGGPATVDLVLRSYEVPNDGAGQMRGVLKDMMWFGSGGKENVGQYVGRAEVSPDGRLLVLATPAVQDGVKAMIDQMGKAPPKTHATIELDYWFVEGKPTAAKEHPAAPAGLSVIAPALAEIEKNDGPQEFTLGEKLVVQGLEGEHVGNQGREWDVSQYATRAGPNAVSVELHLNTRGPQRINTRLQLTPGQIAVLGSSGAGKSGEATGSLYYLVRAAIHDGAGQ